MHKNLIFRKPRCCDGEPSSMLTSDWAIDACENLNTDFYKMLKNAGKIIERLDSNVFQFYRKQKWVYEQNKIYDYVLVLSGYEAIAIKTYDDDVFETSLYLYNSYGHYYNYGYDNICGFINDRSTEKIYNICLSWLMEQPFDTQAEYYKYCHDKSKDE